MTMSTHVLGIAEPDEKWGKMKAAYDACLAADVPVPPEIEDYFDGEPEEGEDEAERDVELLSFMLCLVLHQNDMHWFTEEENEDD